MVAVRWEDFENNPAGFEKLAKLLLLREFHGAVCIDGRGGDGGIDVHWEGPDGLVVFECKKYTKINSTQRRHIRRSLSNAAAHNPSHAPSQNRLHISHPRKLQVTGTATSQARLELWGQLFTDSGQTFLS